MTELITGGAGFIGSHLVNRLLNDGETVSVVDGEAMKPNKVIVVDNLYEGKWSNLPKNERLTCYEASIMGDIGPLFEGVDVVFHLAALTRPQWSIVHPEETNIVNVDGTLRILMHCRDHKVKRVVFASSSSLYGNQETYPTREDAIPNPMCPYALTKLIGEEYCKLFEKLYGMEINCIRPFNAYGPRMNPNGIYSSAAAKFIDQLSKGEIPSITGTGDRPRDYIYIDDIVEIMVLASKSKVYGESFNCGSGENISINGLLELIAKIMGKSSEHTHSPDVYEPDQTLADITKAQTLLGFKAKVGLEEGLRKTIAQTT